MIWLKSLNEKKEIAEILRSSYNKALKNVIAIKSLQFGQICMETYFVEFIYECNSYK